MTARVLPHSVDVAWLAAELARKPSDLVLVDVRWKLGAPGAGAAAYAAGHLPGAFFADVDRDLAAPPSPALGRHPLPSAKAFQAFAEAAGIGDATRVVAYDDQGGATAARLWFLLRYFGHDTGAVLDGGVQAWVAAGHPLSKAASTPARATFYAVAHPELLASADETAALARDPAALVVDARAPERYRGEVEPIDARPGHIPGTRSLPFAGNLADGRLLAVDALKARLVAAGLADKPTVAYCGSGVTACHDLWAAAVAGVPVPRLYAGSWSQWAADANRPVSSGAEPG